MTPEWKPTGQPGREKCDVPSGRCTVKFEGTGYSWGFYPSTDRTPIVLGEVAWDEAGSAAETKALAKQRALAAAGCP